MSKNLLWRKVSVVVIRFSLEYPYVMKKMRSDQDIESIAIAMYYLKDVISNSLSMTKGCTRFLRIIK